MRKEEYEYLLGQIGACRPTLGSKLEFSIMCMCSGVGRTTIENRIYADFGVSGEEFIEGLSDLM